MLLNDLPGFLRGLHDRLEPGSRVMIFDNRFVEGSNHPISRTDTGGNTFQMRTLDNGVRHEVLKNFPTLKQFRNTLKNAEVENIDVRLLDYFWIAQYEIS